MKTPPQAAVDALKQFGVTLDGHAKWRLIWADDKIVIGDGKEIREYAHLPHRWILEKWCVNTIGPEQWERTKDPETGEYILGPYTSGTYELAYAFPQNVDLAPSMVEMIPHLINSGLERYTFNQRRIACRERLEKADKAWRDRNSDIWDDAQDAFKGAAFSGAHGHRIRGPEDIPIRLTTQDIPAELAKRRGFSQA